MPLFESDERECENRNNFREIDKVFCEKKDVKRFRLTSFFMRQE